MDFQYMYGKQADQYSFIHIPKKLVTEKVFTDITIHAKVLYGLLLDRMGTVSYTHLDVYKRQEQRGCKNASSSGKYRSHKRLNNRRPGTGIFPGTQRIIRKTA